MRSYVEIILTRLDILSVGHITTAGAGCHTISTLIQIRIILVTIYIVIVFAWYI